MDTIEVEAQDENRGLPEGALAEMSEITTGGIRFNELKGSPRYEFTGAVERHLICAFKDRTALMREFVDDTDLYANGGFSVGSGHFGWDVSPRQLARAGRGLCRDDGLAIVKLHYNRGG